MSDNLWYPTLFDVKGKLDEQELYESIQILFESVYRLSGQKIVTANGEVIDSADIKAKQEEKKKQEDTFPSKKPAEPEQPQRPPVSPPPYEYPPLPDYGDDPRIGTRNDPRNVGWGAGDETDWFTVDFPPDWERGDPLPDPPPPVENSYWYADIYNRRWVLVFYDPPDDHEDGDYGSPNP